METCDIRTIEAMRMSNFTIIMMQTCFFLQTFFRFVIRRARRNVITAAFSNTSGDVISSLSVEIKQTRIPLSISRYLRLGKAMNPCRIELVAVRDLTQCH